MVLGLQVGIEERKVPSELLFNMDAYAIGIHANQMDEPVYVPTEHLGSVISLNNSLFGGPTLKVYTFMNAVGEFFDPIFVIEDAIVNDDDYIHVYGPGPSQTQDTKGGKAHYCALKKRAGNKKFFDWMFGEYLVQCYDKVETDCMDLRGRNKLFLLDGEPIQLKSICSENILSIFKEKNILV